MRNIFLYIGSDTKITLILYTCVLWLFLVLLRRIRHQKAVHESWDLFHKLSDVIPLDTTEKKLFFRIFKQLHVSLPHEIITSVSFFDHYFTRLICSVDKVKRLYNVKADLLKLYWRVRKKLSDIPHGGTERRKMPRILCHDTVFVKRQSDHENVFKGKLLNISGGGFCLYTREAFKAHQSIIIGFDEQFHSCITARVLHLKEIGDDRVYMIRAKFTFVYPHVRIGA